MNCIEETRTRVEQACGLPSLLDAACGAFLTLLPVIEAQQDPASRWFVPFVMAGPSASGGRFALLDAPSLPATARDGRVPVLGLLPADQVAAAIIGLTQALATRLDDAAVAARQAADRDACTRAARHARDLCASLGGTPPP